MPLVVDRLVSGKRVVCNICGRTHQVDYGSRQYPTEHRVVAKNDEALLVRDYSYWYIAYSRSHCKKLRGTRMYTRYIAFCSSCYYRLDSYETIEDTHQSTLSMFNDFVSTNLDSVYDVPNTKIDENGNAFVPESENAETPLNNSESEDDNNDSVPLFEPVINNNLVTESEEVDSVEPSDDLVYITPVHDFTHAGHPFSLFDVFAVSRELWERNDTVAIAINTRDGYTIYPVKEHFRKLTEEEYQIKKGYIVEDLDGILYRVSEVLTNEDGGVPFCRCVDLVDGIITEVCVNTLKIKRLPDSTQECGAIWRSVNIWRHHTMQL